MVHMSCAAEVVMMPSVACTRWHRVWLTACLSTRNRRVLTTQLCDQPADLVGRRDAELAHPGDVTLVERQHGVVATAGVGDLDATCQACSRYVLTEHVVDQALRLAVAVEPVRQLGGVDPGRQERLGQDLAACRDPLPPTRSPGRGGLARRC